MKLPLPRSLRLCLLLGGIAAQLLACAGAEPLSAPAHQHVADAGVPKAEGEDPWRGLKAAPAPILSFAGESYYPVQASDDQNQRQWEFVRDSEDFSKASRLIIIKVEPWRNVRAYEKAILAKLGVVSREIHFRTSQRLTQSWVTSGPADSKSPAPAPRPLAAKPAAKKKTAAPSSAAEFLEPLLKLGAEEEKPSLGAVREYRLMDWSLRPDGLQCCEIIVRDAVFPLPGASPQWRKELEALVLQAPKFLPLK